MTLTKHFQIREMDYVPLLCVPILILKSYTIKRIKRKEIAVHEGGRKLASGVDIQCEDAVTYYCVTIA